MGTKVITIFALLACSLRIQQILCDQMENNLGANEWICTCSTADKMNFSITPAANCIPSCDCKLAAGEPNQNRWMCSCSANGLPRVASEANDTSCFTSCDCHSGASNEVQPPKKRLSSKAVLIILLLCVTLATITFVLSALYCVYWKERVPIHMQRPLFSSDREASFNSSTNLISQRASSMAENKSNTSHQSSFSNGWFCKVPFLFRSKVEAFHGTVVHFAYYELENATDKFSDSNLIGVGGSSHVYKGCLKDGRFVAIKRIKAQGGQETESAFLREIELIARLHHCHVVPFLGYCSEHQGKRVERLLVFEYMPNGNLRDCLDGASGSCLGWETRVAIALGAARGLEYLHDAAAPRILHRDVKSTNILLDDNWRAKITDLGMAKQLKNDGLPSCSSSPARMQGTFGYFAPEYAIVGRASLKSDVFSFGVVLLELITGRQPIHKSPNKGEESLVIWATPCLQDSKRVILELPDPRLEGNFQEEEMQVMAYLAKECLLLDPDSRPTMSEVVQILSTIAPAKSKRKNFPLSAFQNLTCYSGQHQRFDSTINPDDTEEIKQVTSDHLESLPQNCGGNDPQVEKSRTGADTSTVEFVQELFLHTSKSDSLHSQDDESTVDLTEPRFESFHLASLVTPTIIASQP